MLGYVNQELPGTRRTRGRQIGIHAFNWSPEQVLTGQSPLVNKAVTATDWDAHTVLAWEESEPPRFRLGYWEGCDQHAELTIPNLDALTGQVDAVTLSGDPGIVCVLTRESYTIDYQVICAEISE